MVNHFSSKTDQWATPQHIYDNIIQMVGVNPQWDLAADENNTKCVNYITEQQDSLQTKWPADEICWINPPYGNMLKKFAKKCVEEMESSAPPSKVIWLIPARTDTVWFNLLANHPKCSKVMFLKGRVKFGDGKADAPFPTVVIVMDSKHQGSTEVSFNNEVRK